MKRFGEYIRRHGFLAVVLILFVILAQGGWAGSICLDWDEANLLALAKLPVSEMIHMLEVRHHHPLGFLFWMRFWITLFGESDLSLRWMALFPGILGVIAVYLFSFGLSGGKRRVAAFSALVMACSPFIIRFSTLATPYSLAFASTLFSWFCFTRLPDVLKTKPIERSGYFWGYVVSTLIAVQTFISGFIFLFFQALWVLLEKRRELSQRNFWILGGIGVLICLTNLPLFILFLKPWYIVHSPDLEAIHPYTGIPMFLFTPVNLLLFGFDIRDYWLMGQQPLWMLVAVGVMGGALLVWSGREFYKRYPDLCKIVLYVGVYPVIFVYGISLVFHLSVFHLRTLLYCAFSFAFLLGWLVDDWIRRRKLKWAWLLFVLVIWLQIFSPNQRGYFEDLNCYLVRALQAEYQPSDGLVIEPGWNHLSIVRYLDPGEFGLTRLERASDPRRENLFHMVQRIDERFFFVSGEDVWIRPEVQEAFGAFQKKHARIWLVSRSPVVLKLLDCQREYRVLDNTTGKFVSWRCERPEN